MLQSDRRRRQRALKAAILIATNGAVTEPTYLKELAQRRSAPNLAVTVKIVNGNPIELLKKLTSPLGKTSAYDEVWLVVDEDGSDRTNFVRACEKQKTKRQRWFAVVSRPCFEVWLVAHFERVRNYSTQQEAQNHLRELLPPGTPEKSLPRTFPYDACHDAVARCCLVGSTLAQLPSLPPSPGSSMPHLARRLIPELP